MEILYRQVSVQDWESPKERQKNVLATFNMMASLDSEKRDFYAMLLRIKEFDPDLPIHLTVIETLMIHVCQFPPENSRRKTHERKYRDFPVWKCHVCGKIRDDEDISVISSDISGKYNLSPGTVRTNVRYCNDDPDCIERSKTFRFEGLGE